MRKEQVVQRSVREHHPEIAIPWSHFGGDGVSRSLWDNYNWALGASEQSPLFIFHQCIPFNLLQARRHEGKRLLFPPLPPAKSFYRLILAGVNSQVKSAQSLYGHNSALAEVLCCLRYRL